MKVRNLFAALILLAMTTVPAMAVSWSRLSDGHYIDVDSIRPSQTYGSYTFDTKYVGNGSPLEEMNGHKVWVINTNSFVDCRTGYAKTLTYTALDADNKVVMRGKDVQKQYMDANTPGSRAYESFTFICRDQYLDRYPRYNRMWWY